MEIYELALAGLTAAAAVAAAVAACQAAKAARQSAQAAEIANRLELARELDELISMVDDLHFRFMCNMFDVRRKDGESPHDYDRRIEFEQQDAYLPLWRMMERKRGLLPSDVYHLLLSIFRQLEESTGKWFDYWTQERRKALNAMLSEAREKLRGHVGRTVAGV